MSDIAIRVENLSKSYTIRHQQDERYTALRDVITNGAVNLGKRLLGRAPTQDNTREEFWALKDVTFEVKRGERVGIIGRNGAGKSTLLKLLSRITEPTRGRITLHGRVASLLEVGTGFHPELTGRENIFLNGAILGMTRQEIVRKFDEIIDFAGVEKFLDTPVKRYSSGMYVRLAFAVAAHLEPEILVVDEVLAVGDAEFQKKCLGKMEEVADGGRTVLFVSHNMAAVKKLCQRGILLSDAKLNRVDSVEEVVKFYESSMGQNNGVRHQMFPVMSHRYGLRLNDVCLTVEITPNYANLVIQMHLEAEKPLQKIGVGLWVHAPDGYILSKLGPWLTRNVIQQLNGPMQVSLNIQQIERYLSSGTYSISLIFYLASGEKILVGEQIGHFSIPIFDLYGSGIPIEAHKQGVVPLPINLVLPDTEVS